MDSILPAELIIDKNSLNELSVDMCNFFHSILISNNNFSVNHKEISHIRKCFDSLLDEQSDSQFSSIRVSDKEIHMYLITLRLRVLSIPFHQQIVSCCSIMDLLIYFIEKNILDWNSFFQIVVFFSLSPSIAIYYCILNKFT